MLYQKEFISKMSNYFISEALMPKCLDFEKNKANYVSCLVLLTVTNICVWECSVFFKISRDADITPRASFSLCTKAGTAMPFPAMRWMTWSLWAPCSPCCCTCVHTGECLIRVGFVKGQDVTSPGLSLTQNSLLNPKLFLLGVVLSSTHSLVSCV